MCYVLENISPHDNDARLDASELFVGVTRIHKIRAIVIRPSNFWEGNQHIRHESACCHQFAILPHNSRECTHILLTKSVFCRMNFILQCPYYFICFSLWNTYPLFCLMGLCGLCFVFVRIDCIKEFVQAIQNVRTAYCLHQGWRDGQHPSHYYWSQWCHKDLVGCCCHGKKP